VRATVRQDTPQKTAHLRRLPHAAERLEIVELDLLQSSPADFERAVLGCTLVAHTASPVSLARVPEEQLVKPAVEGTLAVLRAVASAAGANVRSVVVTASVASVVSGYSPEEEDQHGPFSEKDWSKVESSHGYAKSKTLAERAAWDFWRSLGSSPSWSLSTVNPSLVLGPNIAPESGSSIGIVTRLLNRQMPLIPAVTFTVVDVRDVAEAHLRALTLPREQTEGHRFVLAHERLSMVEMGAILNDEFAPMGYNPTTGTMPKWLAYIAGLFMSELHTLLPRWDRPGATFDVTPSKVLLGIEYRDVREAVRLSGYSAIHLGLVPKTPGLKQRWVPPGA